MGVFVLEQPPPPGLTPRKANSYQYEKQARFGQELRYLRSVWGRRIAGDPYYNPNLTLVREDYFLAFPPRLPKVG